MGAHFEAHFEALVEGVLMAPLDPRYTQVGFNLISVQVWLKINFYVENLNENFYAKMGLGLVTRRATL